MPTTFTPNHAGIAAMARSQEMVQAMRRRAEKGHEYALTIAPERTGRYKEHFKIEAGVRDGRAYGFLYNDVRALDANGQEDPDGYPYSLALEYGTKYMTKQRILGRCLDFMERGGS